MNHEQPKFMSAATTEHVRHDNDDRYDRHGKHHQRFCPRHSHYYDDKAVVDSQDRDFSNDTTGMRDFLAGSFAGVSSAGIVQ
jgi:hypothetical protein